MKQLNKLSIVIVSVLVMSVVATVNLCCAALEVTDLGLLMELGSLGYPGPEPINIAEPCTPLEGPWYDSTRLVTVPPGGVELCCAQIVPTNDPLAEQLLSKAGYNGSIPVDVGLPSSTPRQYRQSYLWARAILLNSKLDAVAGMLHVPVHEVDVPDGSSMKTGNSFTSVAGRIALFLFLSNFYLAFPISSLSLPYPPRRRLPQPFGPCCASQYELDFVSYKFHFQSPRPLHYLLPACI
ncbi:hypothetical protein C8R45DRAFT_943521 [Mycena sanguinolenta]|nr:hypothetical protein C8R45DRAFT_943521 [Mycena sanguinolenta]